MYIYSIILLCLLVSSSVQSCILRYQNEFAISLESPVNLSTQNKKIIIKNKKNIYQFNESKTLKLIDKTNDILINSEYISQVNSSDLNTQLEKFIAHQGDISFVGSVENNDMIYLVGHNGIQNTLFEFKKSDLIDFDFDNANRFVNVTTYDILTPSYDGVGALVSDLAINHLNNTLYVSSFIPINKSNKQEYINYVAPIHLDYIHFRRDIGMYFEAKDIQKENKNQKIESIAVLPTEGDITGLYLSMTDNKGSSRILKYQLLD